MHLPDVNVWLALSFESHVHHRAARSWFDEVITGSCFFCRLTQIGFLRLASNPRAFGAEAVSMEDAWGLYAQFQSDDRVGVVSEPSGTEAVWRAFTSTRSFSPKVWNDAYLAAFAKAGGLQAVTFDQGFDQYTGIGCRILGRA